MKEIFDFVGNNERLDVLMEGFFDSACVLLVICIMVWSFKNGQYHRLILCLWSTLAVVVALWLDSFGYVLLANEGGVISRQDDHAAWLARRALVSVSGFLLRGGVIGWMLFMLIWVRCSRNGLPAK